MLIEKNKDEENRLRRSHVFLNHSGTGSTEGYCVSPIPPCLRGSIKKLNRSTSRTRVRRKGRSTWILQPVPQKIIINISGLHYLSPDNQLLQATKNRGSLKKQEKTPFFVRRQLPKKVAFFCAQKLVHNCPANAKKIGILWIALKPM
ncbi:MAG: hypothetical protein EOO14_06720 [Chitinophagaceae bacterium]|nr:MAG: hypothetical protein EOO14_06720 [Chitinophagaceae bacterium]